MDTLQALGRRRDRLRDELAAVESELKDAIIKALNEGERPGDVAKKSTYSIAQVRVIARTAGLGPALRGPARKSA